MSSAEVVTSTEPTADIHSERARRAAVEAYRQTVFRRPSREDTNPIAFRRRRRRTEVICATALPVGLILLWQLASTQGWIDQRFFPSPTDIWSAGVEMARSGELQTHLWASFGRMIMGFLLGCITGLAAAIPLSMSRLARATVEPLIYALWTVPKLALLPMLLLIFGIGEKPIIILITINCFFLVFIPTLAAMVAVPFAYREAAASFKANRWQVLRHVTFPAALPAVFVALRLTAGASILVLVAVEFVQTREGMGFVIWNSWSLFLADRMYVGIVIVAVAGALFTMLIAYIGRRVTPWSRDR